MVNLVWVFWGPDDQKCPLRVLLRFVVWGSKKLFLGVSKKINFFLCKLLTMANILRILKKISKNLIFWWGWVVRVKKSELTCYSHHVLYKNIKILIKLFEVPLGPITALKHWITVIGFQINSLNPASGLLLAYQSLGICLWKRGIKIASNYAEPRDRD